MVLFLHFQVSGYVSLNASVAILVSIVVGAIVAALAGASFDVVKSKVEGTRWWNESCYKEIFRIRNKKTLQNAPRDADKLE
jgi:fucose permease